MKKFSISACVLVLLFGITGMAHALTLTQTLNHDNYGDFFLPDDGRHETSSPYYRYRDQDWGWTHAFSFDAPPVSITSASLEIEAWDVDPEEVDIVTGDGVKLGQLTGINYDWATTVFDFNPDQLYVLNDEELYVFLDIDTTPSTDWWAVTIGSSTLTIEYELDEGSGGPAPTPEPTTMLLVGSGLVGLTAFRKRFKK
jgi:hypothetical protein